MRNGIEISFCARKREVSRFENRKDSGMKTKLISALIMVMGILLSYSCVYGQAEPPSSELWVDDYSAYLGLTSGQNKKIRELQIQFLKETSSSRNTLDVGYLEIRALLNQPGSESSALLAKNKEIHAVEQKLQEKALQYALKIKAVLTDEQKALLPPGCLSGFLLGRGYGLGPGRGLGRGLGLGPGSRLGRNMGRGIGMGLGRGYTRGPGRGIGRGTGGRYWRGW
jgi:hypothetical protein